MSDNSNDAITDLHTETVKLLLQKVKDGTATSADLSVARNLCRDAGVGGLKTSATPLGKLEASLPSFEPPDLPRRSAPPRPNEH